MNSRLLLIIVLTNIISYNYSQEFIQLSTGSASVATIYNAISQNIDIEGSPYLNDDWVQGSILISNDRESSINYMNYDVYGRKIVFFQSQQIYSLNADLEIDKFNLGDKVFVKVYLDEDKILDYMEVLHEDPKISLLKKYKCTFVLGKESYGAIPGRNDKFIMQTELYVKTEKQGLVRIRFRKESVLKVLYDHAEAVNEFAKRERLNYKKEVDLMKIFEFYGLLSL